MIYIGTVLYGYCEGYFGRDSYADKRIEAFGADWIVVRESDKPNFVSFNTNEEMCAFVDKNSNPELGV